MSAEAELAGIKRKVSAAILRMDGVAGVGLPAQGLTVYLENDSQELREKVANALEPLHLTVPIHWEVAGKFQRL